MPTTAYAELFSRLDADALVISVNQRLAQFLQTQYAHWQREQGKQAWASGRILSLNNWLDQCWQSWQLTAGQPLTVLAPGVESWWWQEIVKHSADGHGLITTAPTAQLAQAAWQQCVSWCQVVADIPQPVSDDVAEFMAWAKQFEQRCEAEAVVPMARRLDLLTTTLSDINLTEWAIGPQIYLLGFDTIPPQLQHFLDCLKQRQVAITAFELPSPNAHCQAVACHDRRQEIRAAIRQAAAVTDETMAIVIPDLHSQYDLIEHECRYLAEQHIPYSISGGRLLSDYPLIADAVLSLRLPQLQERDDWLHWLQSPFLGGAEIHRSIRDKLARQLYTGYPQRFGLKTLQRLAAEMEGALPSLPETTAPSQATRSQWGEYWLAQLAVLGWPGDRALDSAEHQTVEKFYQVLQRWVIDFGVGEIKQKQALRELQHCLAQTLFQPQSVARPQVMFLGLLEVAGLCFDHIWLVGMNDTILPAKASPNPFLPAAWQRSLHMPHSSAERELAFAQALLARLPTQAADLTASYAAWEGEMPLAPSQLLKAWPITPCQVDTQPAFTQHRHSETLEELDDSIGLPANGFSGSAQLFKSQALCPFQAYAKFRLQAEDMLPAETHLDAALRGTILHQVLERCWRQLQDQTNLQNHTDAQLTALVQTQIRAVLHYWQQRQPAVLTNAVLELETTRLSQLVSDWLHYEKQREPFTVKGHEQELLGEVEGIALNLRLDRVDQLSNGDILVIDYKTGRTSVSAWLGDRPTEPQLPLYVLLSNADAATFAQLRADKIGFAGLSKNELGLDGIQTVAENRYSAYDNWQDQQQHWQRSFSQLATEIKQGYAAVEPVSVTTACQYCDLLRLCRRGQTVPAADG